MKMNQNASISGNGNGNSNPLASSSSSQLASQSMRILMNLNEKDVIKLILEFLANRELNISLLDLERETGIINAAYSDDILFLRQLILDGQWDDVIEFIQPLKAIESFNMKHFQYLIMKYQYLELLCLKSEANVVDNQLSVEQLVTYLNDLKPYCPTEEDHKKLCLLLTSPRLQDHNEYRTWNPSSGRLQCFKEIYPLISKYLMSNEAVPSKQTQQLISQNERLVQLIVKGLLYESCVEYCQARATNSDETYNLSEPSIMLMQMQLSETDASLLSWLHSLRWDTFSCAFEEKPLKINMERFNKPNLEATWADAILATPIKPQQLFPYNAVPSGRSRNTELMSRSLAPQYEGLSFGLNRSQIFTSGIEMQLNNASPGGTVTNGNSASNFSEKQQQHFQQQSQHQQPNYSMNKRQNQRDNVNELTRSIALFTYTESSDKAMSSPTQLQAQSQPSASNSVNAAPQFNQSSSSSSSNSSSNNLPSSLFMSSRHHPTILNGIKEEELPIVNSPPQLSPQISSTSSSSTTTTVSATSTQQQQQKQQQQQQQQSINKPALTTTAPTQSSSQSNSPSGTSQTQLISESKSNNPMSDSSLFREYQKNKAQIIQQIEEQERRREEFVKQLKSPNVHNALNAVSKANAIKNATKTSGGVAPSSSELNQSNNNSVLTIAESKSHPNRTLDNSNLADDSIRSPKSVRRSVVSPSGTSGSNNPSPAHGQPTQAQSTSQQQNILNQRPDGVSKSISGHSINSAATITPNRSISDAVKFDSLEVNFVYTNIYAKQI
jgi:hypothetical protein